jgi:D-inositol-3-phosphate glycosyltransferase
MAAVERVAMLSLHTSPLDQPGTGSSGGMNVYVRELARALGVAGIEVDIFTRAPGGRLSIVSAGPGVRVVAVPAGPHSPLPKGDLAAFAHTWAGAIAALACAERRPYDLVHSHYWISGLAGITLARAWQTPLVHMFHTLSRLKTRFAGAEPDIPRARGEQQVLDAASAVVVANSLERIQLLQNYTVRQTQLVTIPCGIDAARFRAPRSNARGTPTSLATLPSRAHPVGQFVIAALGRAERLKNFAMLIDAVAVACSRDAGFAASVDVRIAGGAASDEPEVLPELVARARSRGLASRVRFTGPIARDRVPQFYAGADCCVVPSRYESFGLVALEAMAAGIPVIATRVGGLQVTIEDGVDGYLVGPDDAEAMADRLLALWSSPALRARMGSRGRRAAQHYAWPLIADRVACLYQGLVTEPSRALAGC